jgi:hypothetical protein
MRRRASIAAAWRKILTLGLVRVYGSVRRLGTWSRSLRGTSTEATLSHTPRTLMVTARALRMRRKRHATPKSSCSLARLTLQAHIRQYSTDPDTANK